MTWSLKVEVPFYVLAPFLAPRFAGLGYLPAMLLAGAPIAGTVLVVPSAQFVFFEKPFIRRNWHVHLFGWLHGGWQLVAGNGGAAFRVVEADRGLAESPAPPLLRWRNTQTTMFGAR